LSAQHDHATRTDDGVFTWHPDYRGQSLQKVRNTLAADIERDQRAYELALLGAEESEHDALASVVDVERRWSRYHFGWNEVDPAELADRIARFEWEREQRQEMISWQDYRNASGPATARSGGEAGRASMDDGQRRRLANILAGVILALIVVALVVVFVL